MPKKSRTRIDAMRILKGITLDVEIAHLGKAVHHITLAKRLLIGIARMLGFKLRFVRVRHD